MYCNTVLCGKLQCTATEVLWVFRKLHRILISSMYVDGIVMEMELGQNSKTNVLQELSRGEESWEP
jgi:hypothetical protein